MTTAATTKIEALSAAISPSDVRGTPGTSALRDVSDNDRGMNTSTTMPTTKAVRPRNRAETNRPVGTKLVNAKAPPMYTTARSW